MMKLVSLGIFQSRRTCGFSRFFRVLFHSTEIVSSERPRDTLRRRISPVRDPGASIVPVLDKWIEEGKSVKRVELRTIIKLLRSYKRFKHALEISQWMSDKRYFQLSPADLAIRLDLISKVHGLGQAEKYFNNIPNQLRGHEVHGALLNCYAYERSVEKAEAHLQKMEELGLAVGSLSYNVLLNLYFRTGKHEKLQSLMHEMEERGICIDKFTYSICISAFASASDIDGMENVLKRMEMDPEVVKDWNAYAAAANGYLKAGFADKALAMLKRSEELVTGKNMRVAYESLLTFYASLGKIDELYRLWEHYKSTEKVFNKTYMCMISSLMRLDDIDGAEKILEEWESGNSSYDFRVPNLLIAAYWKKGLLGRAEAFINRSIERGKKPYSRTWIIMAYGYLKVNQNQKAVDTVRKAISASRPGWKLSQTILNECEEYLKGKGDLEGAEELLRLVRDSEPILIGKCDILTTCFKDESGFDTNNQMEGWDLGADGEALENLDLRPENTIVTEQDHMESTKYGEGDV